MHFAMGSGSATLGEFFGIARRLFGKRSSLGRRSVYCRHCQYNLTGLPEHRCPECGRGFNHDDPDTFDDRPGGRPRWPVRAVAIGIGYPWLVVVGLLATWLTAFAVLGRPPRASMDDPKDLGPAVGAFYSLTMLAAPGLPLGMMLWVVGMQAIVRSKPYERLRPFVTVPALALVSWALAFFLIRGPLEPVTIWFAD